MCPITKTWINWRYSHDSLTLYLWNGISLRQGICHFSLESVEKQTSTEGITHTWYRSFAHKIMYPRDSWYTVCSKSHFTRKNKQLWETVVPMSDILFGILMTMFSYGMNASDWSHLCSTTFLNADAAINLRHSKSLGFWEVTLLFIKAHTKNSYSVRTRDRMEGCPLYHVVRSTLNNLLFRQSGLRLPDGFQYCRTKC